MCAALRRPHLRQTHVVLIHCMQTASFRLSASPSLRNLSRVSSSIPSALPLLPFLRLWQQSPFLSQYILPFHGPCPLPTSFLYGSTFFKKCVFSPPRPPIFSQHISLSSTPLWNLWNMFLQEHHNGVTAGCITYPSHPTALRERVMPKRLSSPEMCDCVCGWSCILWV